MTVITWLLDKIGLAGIVFVGMLFFYEGAPAVSSIPYVGKIPIIGNLAVGRVASYAADQVEAATTQMVSKASADALAALLAHERRMRAAAETAAEAARLRANATALALDAANERARQLEAQAREDGLPTWSPEELEWYGKH